MLLTASADGAADGSTIILAALDGREDNADVGKYAVVTFSASDVRFGLITSSLGPPAAGNPAHYTLTIVPPLTEKVTAGLVIEVMAYRPDWYSVAGIVASTSIFPWLYKPLYDASIAITDPSVMHYPLPAGIAPSDVTRVAMQGAANSPYASAPLTDFPSFKFYPTGTLGAQELWLNLDGAPFVMSPVADRHLVLIGWQHLTLLLPDAAMWVITGDVDTTHAPELDPGSEEDILFREWVLAYLFRTIMAAPATPDRNAFANAFSAQMTYALQQATSHMMTRPERRRTQ